MFLSYLPSVHYKVQVDPYSEAILSLCAPGLGIMLAFKPLMKA